MKFSFVPASGRVGRRAGSRESNWRACYRPRARSWAAPSVWEAARSPIIATVVDGRCIFSCAYGCTIALANPARAVTRQSVAPCTLDGAASIARGVSADHYIHLLGLRAWYSFHPQALA